MPDRYLAYIWRISWPGRNQMAYRWHHNSDMPSMNVAILRVVLGILRSECHL